jgi:hypothetical protein
MLPYGSGFKKGILLYKQNKKVGCVVMQYICQKNKILVKAEAWQQGG